MPLTGSACVQDGVGEVLYSTNRESQVLSLNCKKIYFLVIIKKLRDPRTWYN
jgi:hypothetical protein